MAHAWLDSLSEDWESQAGSDASQPALSIRSQTHPRGATAGSSLRHVVPMSPTDSSNVLSERSVNEIFGSRRVPSKSAQEHNPQDQGRATRRSTSISTMGSVIHNTVERTSQSVLPDKSFGETPEWKRRLVYGNVAYGEQCDLFSSAARQGLESIFQPPPAPTTTDASLATAEEYVETSTEALGTAVEEDYAQGQEQYADDPLLVNTTLPSSPPLYQDRYETSANFMDESAGDQDFPLPARISQEVAPESESTKQQIFSDESLPQDSQSVQHEEDQESSCLDRESSTGSQIHHQMQRESRMVSGQSVLRNESFSAIMISPEKDANGDGVVFGPVELAPGDLKRRLENLRWNQMTLGESVGDTAANASVAVGGKSLNAENTEEYEKMGGFINFRRGGRSADGSFRDHLLSGTDTSEMLPEESLQASTPKQFPTIRTQHATIDSKHMHTTPRAPNPSPEKLASSGSPLKLFGPYDTFTNQTLMRRISQFEEQMSDGSRSSVHSIARAVAEPSSSEIDNKSLLDPHNQAVSVTESRTSSAQFGAGDLNGFQFAEDFSQLSQDTAQPSDGDESQTTNDQHVFPRLPFNSGRADVPSESQRGELHIQRLRNPGSLNSSRGMASQPGTINGPPHDSETHGTVGKMSRVVEVGTEGKRPRTSPSKDPTPKRRRTLHKSDVAFGLEQLQEAFGSVRLSHQHMQSIMDRKRRDTREQDGLQPGSDMLSNLDIMRPRTPTPSQRSSLQRDTAPSVFDPDAVFNSYDNSKFGTPGTRLSRPSGLRSQISAADPSAPALGPASDGDRKPSIRTEDFMNEANKIMAMLRNRGGVAQSGLTSLEESEMEHPSAEQQEDCDGSFQESTREPFSRPPSREGKPSQWMSRLQDNPSVVAKLKQYEERSDLDDLVSSTTRSINLAQDAIQAEREAARAVQSTIGSVRIHSRTNLDEGDVISDPPNIRITSNSRRTDADAFGLQDGIPSQTSHASVSSSNSTGRSIPTGSSRGSGSDSRKTIAPQTVSHLIPDQVGNMVLDRDRNIWFKRRSGSGRLETVHNILPSEGSEDDPFADIPDLSVDPTLELNSLKVTTTTSPTDDKGVRPPLDTDASLASLLVHRPSGIPAIASKATNEYSVLAEERQHEAVEHEISIDEGRISRNTPSKRRHLAISFSSPIASIIQDFAVDNQDRGPKANEDQTEEDAVDVSKASIHRGRRTVSVKFQSTSLSSRDAPPRSRSNSRGVSRQMSVAGQAFVPRSISRIEEREEDDTRTRYSPGKPPSKNRELSLIGDHSQLAQSGNSEMEATRRQTSLSFVVATPGRPGQVDDEQVLTECVGMLSLSPMPEFTIHQERSLALEASYVLGDRHLATGDGSKAVMSQSLQTLVEKLAEVQPFEPYWEDMEDLNVQDKRLDSLHKLDEFCPQLVTLDAADNLLRNLSGIPATVRHLRIVHNQLSDLTSWARLANLQYLDISNNDIKTLSGLKNLVHLRGLKADNCGLTSLDGIKFHDGLQTLRARGNEIEAVDFDGTRLEKLVELDLEANRIDVAANLNQLSSLVALNLRQNELAKFSPQDNGALLHLRSLNLSDNHLTNLDVKALPSLRLLHADRNRLVRVRGFSKTPRLDSLSLREQAGSERLDISSLYHAYEIRKLYLSGNYLESFNPPVDFLNLQLLELANCGLTTLPVEFGLSVPNVRKLNLNFNALTDLASLRGIPRLKKVLVAGNRLAHAYSVIRVLAEFANLGEADLRDNPLTQGFYPHVQALVSTKDTANASAPQEPFTLPSAEMSADRAYSGRLDLPTGMRRRVYQQVFGDACRNLKQLDGLPVDRTLGELHDAVWQSLNDKGIVSKVGEEKKKAVVAAKEGGMETKEGDVFA